MPDTTAQIESSIREFVNDMHALIRQVVIDAVTVPGAAPKRGPGRPPKTAVGATATARKTQRKTGRVGGRRAPATVAKTIESVRDYIVANPGQGAEQICPALHLTTSQLALPMKKLLASKHISRKGVRRATRYFPGPNATGKLPAPSPSGRPRR